MADPHFWIHPLMLLHRLLSSHYHFRLVTVLPSRLLMSSDVVQDSSQAQILPIGRNNVTIDRLNPRLTGGECLQNDDEGRSC